MVSVDREEFSWEAGATCRSGICHKNGLMCTGVIGSEECYGA